MPVYLRITATVLLLAAGFASTTAYAQDEMPNAFSSVLVAQFDYGDGSELLDMAMSYCNEYEPELVANPVCNGFLAWDGVDFYTIISYSAEDEFATWDAQYEISGRLSIHNFAKLDGMDVPYLEYAEVSAAIDWYGDDGVITSEAWVYDIYDVPPSLVPLGGTYYDYYGDPPADSLAYSIYLDGAEEVFEQIGMMYNGLGFFDEADPELEFYDEFILEDMVAAEFDLVLYYVE